MFTVFHTCAGAVQLDVNSETVNSELVQEHEKRLEGWSTAELELFFTELVMELEMVNCLSAAVMFDCWWRVCSSSAAGLLPALLPGSVLGGCTWRLFESSPSQVQAPTLSAEHAHVTAPGMSLVLGPITVPHISENLSLGHSMWAHHKIYWAADVQALVLISASTALIVLSTSVMTGAKAPAAIAAEMY